MRLPYLNGILPGLPQDIPRLRVTRAVAVQQCCIGLSINVRHLAVGACANKKDHFHLSARVSINVLYIRRECRLEIYQRDLSWRCDLTYISHDIIIRIGNRFDFTRERVSPPYKEVLRANYQLLRNDR